MNRSQNEIELVDEGSVLRVHKTRVDLRIYTPGIKTNGIYKHLKVHISERWQSFQLDNYGQQTIMDRLLLCVTSPFDCDDKGD